MQQRDEELGRPAGFGVYTGIRTGDDAKTVQKFQTKSDGHPIIENYVLVSQALRHQA